MLWARLGVVGSSRVCRSGKDASLFVDSPNMPHQSCQKASRMQVHNMEDRGESKLIEWTDMIVTGKAILSRTPSMYCYARDGDDPTRRSYGRIKVSSHAHVITAASGMSVLLPSDFTALLTNPNHNHIIIYGSILRNMCKL